MSTVLSPVEVINTIKAKNGLPFPIADDADLWGGYRAVATLTERGEIPLSKMKLGMGVWVVAEGKFYILTSTSPIAWIEFGPTAGGVPDGNKGDITVTGGGLTWTIGSGVVSTTKMGGDVTASGKALLTAATADAQRTALGLGTAAVRNLSVGTAAPSGGADGDIYLQYT